MTSFGSSTGGWSRDDSAASHGRVEQRGGGVCTDQTRCLRGVARRQPGLGTGFPGWQ